MYFNFLPSIKYDVKPISYPFSESDYVVAKNFFRRYKISDTVFDSAVFYKKYAIGDQVRLDQLAEIAYGDPFYDWVIALVNNMINPLHDLPMTETELRKHIESRYDNPYYDIHHYEVISEEEQNEKFGKVLMPGGTVVDESFYNGRKTLVADTLPDLSSTSKTITVLKDYIFTSPSASNENQWDNSFLSESSGAAFESYGTGSGSDGGFVLSPPLRNEFRPQGYLRFRGNNYNERYAAFNPIDTTLLTKFQFIGKFGDDINGGEWPDQYDERLDLQYRNDPNDPWTTITYIVGSQTIQGFDYDATAPMGYGYGGTGRIPGYYENVEGYASDLVTPTSSLSGDGSPFRCNVLVNNDGSIGSVEVVDRGHRMDAVGDIYIRNEDLGNGYFLDQVDLGAGPIVLVVPVQPLRLFNVDKSRDRNGYQYGRFDTEPFTFSVDIPPEARTTSTEFRLYQPDNTGIQMDQYAVQTIRLTFTDTAIVPPEFDFTQIDNDNYIIDGVAWNRNNGTWYRVTQTGYRYYDNGIVNETFGSELSRPVTEFEYESNENEKKREIYILKPAYLSRLVDDFRKAALYKKSSDFVSNRLKKTGV